MPLLSAVIDVLVPPGPQAAALAERLRGISGRHALDVHVVDRAAGCALHPDRDVVLLEASAHLGAEAIDRLVEAASRETGVATVSAFCSRARWSGYPEARGVNAMPEGETFESLAGAFSRANPGVFVEIPAADGALVLVTRAALGAAGAPDEGEGGLATFSARAHAQGLRHLVRGDVFVLDAAPRPIVAPGDDDPTARAFAERDPLRPLRRRVDLGRLAASTRPRLLLVSHHWGGGVQRHVEDVARLAGETAEVLLLRPDGPEAVELAWLRPGESLRAWFDESRWPALVELLRAIGISRMHLHHVHQLPQAVLDLPEALGAPYDVTLHDYFPICPRYHLKPAPDATCDQDPGRCERCNDHEPAQWGLSLEEWRARFHAFLRGAARVIAPSHDCAARVRSYFPDVAIREWSHPEMPQGLPTIHKVVLLGGLSAIKGSRVLEACVADARERRLPLHFHVIGHVERPTPVLPEAPLTIGGSYAEETLPLRIAIERPDAILFLPQVVETYSYTLSAALASGLPIAALAVGVFPERLRAAPDHLLLARDASPAAINDALLALVRRRREPARFAQAVD